MAKYNKTDRALVDLVISQILHTTFGSITMIVLVGVVLWPVFGALKVGLWILLGFFIAVMRLLVLSKLENGQIFPDNYIWRERTAAISLMILGTHWGSAAWLFLDPSNANIYAFVVGAVLGVASGTLASASPRPNLWLAFGASEFTIVTAKFLSIGYMPLAIMSVVFTMGVYYIAKSLGKRIETSITKDFRNAELLVEVSASKDLAEKANLEKSQFMAATSHDLRQPLHAQGLLLEALKGKKYNDTQNEDLIKKLTQSNNALNTLFDSLLEISQLDANTITANISHQSIFTICQQAMSDLEPLAEKKNLTLKLKGENCTILSDPILLGRIIRNLLSNAIKYTETGGVEIEVQTHSNSALLLVKDTGIGIASEEHKAIFNEYTQINNNSRDRRYGVGLGLAIVRRMCLLLEHEINVESALGEGASFKLTIPLGKKSKIIDLKNDITNSNIKGWNIVIVDDEEPILDAMQVLFQQWDCRCHAFTTLEEAEKTLIKEKEHISMIISDYRLSNNVTGIECIERLRQLLNKQIPAIIISGDTDPKLLKKVQNMGFQMLHKPLKPAKLRNLMSILLSD